MNFELALELGVLVVFLLKKFLGINHAQFFLPHFLHHLNLALVLQVEQLTFLGRFQLEVSEFGQLAGEPLLRAPVYFVRAFHGLLLALEKVDLGVQAVNFLLGHALHLVRFLHHHGALLARVSKLADVCLEPCRALLVLVGVGRDGWKLGGACISVVCHLKILSHFLEIVHYSSRASCDLRTRC